MTLCDDAPAQARDLGLNFFLSEKDLGVGRAAATQRGVQQLNSDVQVFVHEGELTEELVAAHDAVVVTEGLGIAELIRWNNFCRGHTKPGVDGRGQPTTVPAPILFVWAFSGGAMGSVFVDHGPNFVLRDPNGKEPMIKLVTDITQHVDDDGHPYALVRYQTPDGQAAESLPDNCFVEFSEIEGCYTVDTPTATRYGTSLNTSGPWKCTHPESDPVNTVRIGDLTGFSAYAGHGLITEVKQPQPVIFRSLAECIAYPASTPTGVVHKVGDDGFACIDMMSQFMPGGIESQIHVALQGVMAFQREHKRLPRANDQADTAAVRRRRRRRRKRRRKDDEEEED